MSSSHRTWRVLTITGCSRLWQVRTLSRLRLTNEPPASAVLPLDFARKTGYVRDTEARYPSGKGEVCKTFMRGFDSHPRLQLPHKSTAFAGPSLRSGFRLRAPAPLTPAKRLKFDSHPRLQQVLRLVRTTCQAGHPYRGSRCGFCDRLTYGWGTLCKPRVVPLIPP